MHSFSRWDPRTSSPGTAEEERTCGSLHYLEAIAALHRAFEPAFYLEIGVRHGHSLALAHCPAIGASRQEVVAKLRAALNESRNLQ
jgi:hypothetical protein